MPSPEQIRKERINKLLEWARNQKTNFTTIDPLLQKTQELFPMVSKETAQGYSEAVLRILTWKKKEKGNE